MKECVPYGTHRDGLLQAISVTNYINRCSRVELSFHAGNKPPFLVMIYFFCTHTEKLTCEYFTWDFCIHSNNWFGLLGFFSCFVNVYCSLVIKPLWSQARDHAEQCGSCVFAAVCGRVSSWWYDVGRSVLWQLLDFETPSWTELATGLCPVFQLILSLLLQEGRCNGWHCSLRP